MGCNNAKRSFVTVSVAAAILAGCSYPGGKSGPAPALQEPASAKTATSDALVYTGSNVYDLVSGRQVGQLSGFDPHFTPEGLCTGEAGDIFVSGMLVRSAAVYGSDVYRFAHGAFTPEAMVSETGAAIGCAVDPTTGSLAVSNIASYQNFSGSVAVFNQAKGQPAYYMSPKHRALAYCTYDGKGNLYVTEDDGALIEMPKGSTSFKPVNVSNGAFVRSLQWYAGRLILSGFVPHRQGTPVYLYRASVGNGIATVEQTTTLSNKGNFPSWEQFYVDGTHVVGSGHRGDKLLEWTYPAGGLPATVLSTTQYFGVVISK
jgi:hypothetical protein